MKIRKHLLLVTLLSALFSTSIHASNMKKEINHLLSFVENTECLFERNGTSHIGKDASEHIIKKYNYYINDIDSTEKFIDLSASKSTMSGKYYMIACKGKQKIKSQEWLLQELRKFRSQSLPSNASQNNATP